MMKDMTPEQIEQMAAMSPSGMNVDPAMVKQSCEMMKNMSEKDLEMMMDMATKMQASGAMPTPPAAGASSSGAAPQMSPEMMQQVRSCLIRVSLS